MNLRDLHYLATLAETRHFGEAAERCHVSQPTLSMQLKKLEEYLGVQLIERTSRQVLMTPAGEEIAGRARHIILLSEQLVAAAKSARDPLAGDVRLGIFPTLAPYLLPRVMPAFKQHFPRLNLLLKEEKTPEILRQLKSGQLDAALLALPLAEEGLQALPLFEEPFLLAVPVRHRLAKRKSVALAELSRETMLLLEDGHCLREQALQVCHSIGIGEAPNFRATSLETLRHMVAAGNAVTLMPKLAIERGDGQVRYIPFQSPAPSRSIGLCWRATSARRVLYEALAEYIRKTVKI